jgi:hypothetical protein
MVPSVFAALGSPARELPDGIDSEQAQQVIIGLLAVCAVGVIVTLRTIQKFTTRLALVVLLVGLGVGLWFQRENLQDCSGQCECHLFGQDVRVPDPQGNCPEF